MKGRLPLLRLSRSFTLVEMLAALTVFVILGLIVTEIVAMTSRSINVSNGGVGASAQAQIAFGRFDLDLAALVKRADVDFAVGTANNSSSLILLSVVSSAGSPSGGNRNASLVSYQITAHADNPGADGVARPCLVRAGNALGWTSTDFMGLDVNGLPVSLSGTLPTSLTFSASDYDILAPGVLRMVIGFQLYPDNQAVTLADGTTTSSKLADGTIVYSPPVRTLATLSGGTATFTDPSRIAALVVGLVVVDTQTLRLLNSTQVNAIAGQFLVPAKGQLPVQAWASAADGLVSSLGGSIPHPPLQAVRVFEHFFPVTPYGTKMP